MEKVGDRVGVLTNKKLELDTTHSTAMLQQLTCKNCRYDNIQSAIRQESTKKSM